MRRVYAGNEWVLKSGSEEAFIDVWREFASWGRSVVGGAGKTQLLRDPADPRRFLSVGDWESADALADVRARPEYGEFDRRLREHLDTAERRTFQLVAEA